MLNRPRDILFSNFGEQTILQSDIQQTAKQVVAVCIVSRYPKFNGRHFGLPPSSKLIHKITGLGGKMV